jgi:hypothetical protein
MKFELEPNNRGADDETLLNNLREVAALLGEDYVTKTEYDMHGRWCSTTFQKRFRTWCKAHELAGLRKIRNYDASIADCVSELARVAKKVGTTTLSKSEYRPHGRISAETIGHRCGSWNKALERAGLGVLSPHPEGIPNEELFQNLEHLWESLGRQPRISDFVRPVSKYSHASYSRRFGSFRKALEAFVASFDEKETRKPEGDQDEPLVDPVSLSGVIPHRTQRTVSWRIRFLVMRRDNFKCCICGLSPATRPGTVLVVDHIFPWIEGGETVMENLQTLCEPCNGGKSDLLMQAE